MRVLRSNPPGCWERRNGGYGSPVSSYDPYMADTGDGGSASGGPAGRGGFWAFWSTLPGVLTALAALVTAVVGLGSLFIGSVDRTNAPSTSPGAVLPTASSPSGASSGDRSSGGLAQGVLAQGRLTMAEGDTADLEHGLVGQPPNSDLTFYTHDFLDSDGMAPAPEQVDKATCVSALSARHDTGKDVTQLSVGSSLCLQTAEGHVAALRIDSLPGPGAPDVAFTYTVWR